ncbi:hypothetical protein PSH58_15620 [Pseudomonas hefeiensis]|uniref:Uncharacterized protein n=1 Tax=Pseudomonas hefeiensis TaxID=2738125 RepID=A0ABY9G3W8_9PSED|nr:MULTISPECIES: hypothetical protein [unclassified Pseudomonas]WLH10335.1 hypothetical protein PSH57_15600 [Pseudomonas sp. FP205]WLH93412.1 hypothetical protein PSH58_15620 [Pseudomonas sp. FP53]WLI37700.1 hypothetical protein PSH74_15550 [Pseudomonas sp. FP821]
MTIDKQKLKDLLWAEVAAWSVSAPDWPAVTQALEEFLGKQTMEEVALELLVENEALRKERDKLAEDKQGLLEDFAGCL